MTQRKLISRRLFLKDMGRTGVAVMVLGMAACTQETDPSTTSSLANSATTPGSVPSPTSVPSSTTQPGSADGFRWHRVNLGFVSGYILYRGGEATIVDTGTGGSAPDIEAALSEVGLGWGDVGGVIVTHLHDDHQGSLQAVLDQAGEGTPWYAGEGDLSGIRARSDGVAVADGQAVGGLTIVTTPGHTPGHISVLDASAGILVTGDALNGADGGVAGPNPRFTTDMETANQSVRKLAGFDYEIALFGHGEPVLAGASEAVSALAENL